MPKGLITAILIFVSVAGLLFLVSPKYQEWSNSRGELKLKELQLREKENHFSNLRQLSQQLRAKEEALAKIDSALPHKPETSRLLNFLADSAQNNGLLLTEIGSIATRQVFPEKQQTKGEKQKEGGQKQKLVLKETTFSLKLLGDYPSLKNFLASLEKSARLIEIEELSFSSEDSGLFQFNLTAEVHSY